VVKEIKGTFDSSNIPVLSFDPGMVSRPSREMLDEVVIDIKMFNGSVDAKVCAGEAAHEKHTKTPLTFFVIFTFHAQFDGWFSRPLLRDLVFFSVLAPLHTWYINRTVKHFDIIRHFT
jgi:hypothetical protein